MDADHHQAVIIMDNMEEQSVPSENRSWALDNNKSPSSNNTTTISRLDRFLIHGDYGRWWYLGHYGVSERNPTELYMDEHAVRIRAGILHVLSWVVLIHVLFLKNQTGIKVIFPLVAYEFFISSLTGLTPLAPLGTVATLIALILQPKPLWKPASPKRFAWLIGLMLATSCYTVFSLRERLGKAYEPAMLPIVFMCNFFTWLESACGFCVGCWMYTTFLVPFFGWKQCSDCYDER